MLLILPTPYRTRGVLRAGGGKKEKKNNNEEEEGGGGRRRRRERRTRRKFVIIILRSIGPGSGCIRPRIERMRFRTHFQP